MQVSRVVVFYEIIQGERSVNLNSFAGILVCLANAFMPLILICMTTHNTLIIKQHKEPDHIKTLIDIESF